LNHLVSESERDDNDAAVFLLTQLAKEKPDQFLSVALDEGYAVFNKEMDAATAAAMWEMSNTNTSGQRIIIRTLRNFFGHRFMVPEKEVRELGKRAFEPVCGSFVTSNMEKVEYWYRLIHELLKREIANGIFDDVRERCPVKY